MSDDMKLRATVVDQATGPIRDIGRAMRDVARSNSIAPLQREFAGLHGTLSAVGREIRTVTVPAFAAMGLTGGGLVATLIGVGKAIDGIAGKTLDLHYFSREIGLAGAQVKAFTYAAEKLRIAPEAARQGLSTFARSIEDIKLNLEGARDALIRHGAADVVGAIQRSKDNYEALAVVVERMQAISRKNPAAGRRFAEQMFGDPSFARMTLAEITAAMAKFKNQTDADIEAAKRFNDNLIDLQKTLGKLEQTLGNELMPSFADLVKEIDAFFSQEGVGKVIRAEIDGVTKGIRDAVQEVKDLFAWWERVKGYVGFGGGQDTRSDQTREIQKRLADRESQLGSMEGHARAWENSGRGELPTDLRMRRRALLDEIEQLRTQLRTLREEMEKTNNTAKKSSWSGGGGLGGLVVPASFGGGGFGGGGFGGGGGGGSVAMRGLGGLPGIPGGSGGGGVAGTPSGPGGMPTGGIDGAEAFDRSFKGTALEGKWPAVEAAAKANGVPPNVMAAIMAHETGKGSNLRGNNPAGLMDPKTGWRFKQQFGSIDDGIAASGKTIGKNWARAGGDLDAMGRIYAPPGAANDPRGLNAGWAAGVRSFMSGGRPGTLGGYRDAVTNPPLGPLGSSERVRELQGQVAGVRRQPIGAELRAQLDHAAKATGLVAEITSGGQPAPGRGPRVGSTRHDHGGAGDLRLRDPVTGKLMDMRDPADQARMHAFVRESVRAGATGVGAGLGYMGPHTVHIGGGKAAVWGGAGWIRDAYRAGLAAGPVKPETAAGPGFPRGVTPDDGRERMDKALSRMSGTVSGSASIDVTVKAPKGTTVGAGAEGIFKAVKVNRSTQMAPSAEGPGEGP